MLDSLEHGWGPGKGSVPMFVVDGAVGLGCTATAPQLTLDVYQYTTPKVSRDFQVIIINALYLANITSKL